MKTLSYPLTKKLTQTITQPAQLETIYLVLAVWIGILVRMSFLFSADFPLHDGGLFYAMMTDLAANHFQLPEYTSYNAAGIPFVYPPLALYVGSLLHVALKIDLFAILRWFPFAMNILAGGAVYALARTMKFSKNASTTALLAFFLLPESYRWLIMGGGITRSLGFCFAILAIRQFVKLFTQPGLKNALLAGILAGMTILSHLEMAWFAFYSGLLFSIFLARSKKAWLYAFLAAGIAALISAPWAIQVFTRFGAGPIMDAIQGSSSEWPLVSSILSAFTNPTKETFFPILACFAILGAVHSFAKGDRRLPLWVLCVFVLQTRGPFVKATLPLALLISLGGTEMFSFFKNSSEKIQFRASLIAIGLFIFVFFSDISSNRDLVTPLSTAERTAMHWIAENTPADTRVLVIPPERWGSDRTSEWFPILAQRTSVATVQGYEFADFQDRIELSDALYACNLRDTHCIKVWSEQYHVDFDYIYIPMRSSSANDDIVFGDCCAIIRTSFESDPDYKAVFSTQQAEIFAWVKPH